MILKLFGIMDIYSAIAVLLTQWDVGPWRLPLTAAAWLLMKAWLFKGDIGSTIDLGIGVYALIMLLLPIGILSYLSAGYLLWKGVQSVLA